MNISQSQENSVGGEADDGELFKLMAAGGEAGLVALGVFYRRYAEGLHKRTCRIKGLAEADREDFMHETMLRAYRSAHTFKPPDASLIRAAKRAKTMAWLVEIARNLHLEILRKLKAGGMNGFASLEAEDENGEFSHFITDKLRNGEGYHLLRETEEKVIPRLVPPENEEKTESERMRSLKNFLNNLPEKKRDVLLTYFGEDYDYRDPNKPLPRKVIDALKAKHKGLTSANMRQIKKRTFEAADKELKKKE
jgi:RNA polymerase sigma factor (sigma-70 family)